MSNAISDSVRRLKSWKFYFIFAVMVPLILIPYFSSYLPFVAMSIMAYMIYSLSWDLLYSYSGQLSMGHALPFGMGALTMGIFSYGYAIPPLESLVLAAVMASVVQGLVGASTVRLKAGYQAIATFLFAQVLFYIALVVYGEEGISPFNAGSGGVSGIMDPGTEYALGIFLFAASAVALYLIEESSYGTKLKAIKGDALAAEVLGISVTRNKILIFFVSSFFAGLAGAYYTLFTFHVDYSVFSVPNTFLPIGTAVIGGVGTFAGPILGAILVGGLIYLLPIWLSLAFTLLIYGVALIVVLRVIPEGILVRRPSSKRPKPS